MILRVILALIILYVMYRVLKRVFGVEARRVSPLKGQERKDYAMEDLVEDPICHTYLPVSKATVWEEGGEKRYFCSDKCLQAYREGRKK